MTVHGHVDASRPRETFRGWQGLPRNHICVSPSFVLPSANSTRRLPCPVDSWPGDPLPDEDDLPIDAKNGYRTKLREHSADLFPRHTQIHYGQYRREQLFEAARVSTDDQDLSLPIDALTQPGIPKTVIFMDKVSGAKTERLGLTKCLETLTSGDIERRYVHSGMPECLSRFLSC